MSNNVWERFDDIAKVEDIQEAKSQFVPIGEGIYQTTLEEIKADVNKNGLPMLKARFRDKASNKVIFYNLNLQVVGHQWITDKNIAEAILFIEGLIGDEYEYTGLSDMAEYLGTIPVGGEYYVKIVAGKNPDFPEISLIDKPDDIDFGDTDLSDDIPF